MVTDVRKITETRREEREKQNLERRQVIALETIADTLEAIRADLVGTQQVIAQIARKP